MRNPAFLPDQLRSLYLVLASFLALSVADNLRAEAPLHERIDEQIESALAEFESKAAPIADDAEFLRRVYLDFTGMIPTAQQAREFLDDGTPQKREKLIDELLNAPEFARHMTNVFDVMLMERRPDKYVKSKQWRNYLHDSFVENKPYNELVAALLSSDGSNPKTRAAAKFFLDRNGEPNDITKDVSRLFLGMNLQCAQCHDHPLVNDYVQDYYYGIYAFFNRSYIFNDKKKKLVWYAEKADGKVTFESVFKPKVTKETGPRLPGLPAVKEPKIAKGKEYLVKPSKTQGGVPQWSRRAQLAERLASAENVQFKRTAANRLWSLMIGRGIVHPVDFDHPDNPPSHPELMDMLAEEFAKMNFDIKAFLREIALSETYQRSSRMPAGKDLPPADSFALAELRPLSPEQLAWSMMQATSLRENEFKRLGKKASEAAVHGKLARNVAPFVKVFGGQPGDPADLGFQATLDQTLFLRNGTLLRNWLTPRTGSLTHRLQQLKDSKAFADELFLSVLTRYPTDAERKAVESFLDENESDRTAAIQELAWSLLATAEFRFNH